uniref:Uncharacterized protein n=1 Tax=Aegilops tauschii subsp. strangulata TaxID=200361 RepID=A0A453R7Q7_AEGTS
MPFHHQALEHGHCKIWACAHGYHRLASSRVDWWDRRTDMTNPNRRAMASLTMLVSSTIWNEHNARIFRHKSAPPLILLKIVTDEASLWVTAGAKKLGKIVLSK